MASEASKKYRSVDETFRRAFEAKFQPLHVKTRFRARESEHNCSSTKEEADEEEAKDEGETFEGSPWEGFPDTIDKVPVVEHVSRVRFNDYTGNSEKRAFMSANPPLHMGKSRVDSNTSNSIEDEKSDSQQLKNDFALQKLLRESHLLEPSESSLAAVGATRHKAIDLHLRRLGSKQSIYVQEKMPLSHRRGIAGKHIEQQRKRRKEARDNGIILETVSKSKERNRKRGRAVGGPVVGRFQGGTLHLNEKDVANIEGRR